MAFKEIEVSAEKIREIYARFLSDIEPLVPLAEAKVKKEEQRRLGKTTEELGELSAVVGRIGIQGIDEIDPSSGEANRARLQDEMADVMAQLGLLLDFYKLDSDYMGKRIDQKRASMQEWDQLVEANDSTS